MHRIARYGGTCSFLMLDVDHFKKMNDNKATSKITTIVVIITHIQKQVDHRMIFLGVHGVLQINSNVRIL